MSWLTRIFARRTVAPDPRRDVPDAYAMRFVPSTLRLSLDEMAATSVAWGCLRALVDPIASSEVKIFTKAPDGGRVQLVDDESDRGVPVDYLLNVRACAELTAQAFKEILLAQTILHGDGFAEIVRNGAGKPSELVPLDSERMRLVRERGRLVYLYRQDDGTEVALFADEVLHVRGPSIRGLTGNSLVYQAAKAIALHVAQERFATSYFENGAVLGGIVKMPGGLGEDAKKTLRADILKRFGGHKKAHGIAFFEAGMEYQALGGNPSETQLVPSRAFSVEEIARYFGVPLVRLGVQAAAQGYGTNVQQLNLQFVRDTLTPWINRFTEEAVFKLFPQRAPWRTIEIDTAWLTRGDDEQRARAREIDLRSGFITVNEGRADEGRNGIGPTGDLHLVQNSLVVLDEENLQRPEPPKPTEPELTDAPPGRDPEEEMKALLRAGVVLALDNHRRRWVARARDVSEEKVSDARAELRGKFAADLGAFGSRLSDDAFATLATQVEAGVAPPLAVQHVLGGA